MISEVFLLDANYRIKREEGREREAAFFKREGGKTVGGRVMILNASFDEVVYSIPPSFDITVSTD